MITVIRVIITIQNNGNIIGYNTINDKQYISTWFTMLQLLYSRIMYENMYV